ncbi:III protein, CoA-transferase family, partial [Oesophagostomum dentatum]
LQVIFFQENKGLVICRLTGYGQTGPLAHEAGHDINYVAITGLMPTISGHSCNRPWPPVNLLADFAGGGLTAAFGVVAALLKREKNGMSIAIDTSGHGCIIDCSMSEGLSYLASFVHRYHNISQFWTDPYAAFSGDCPIYRQVLLLYLSLKEMFTALNF